MTRAQAETASAPELLQALHGAKAALAGLYRRRWEHDWPRPLGGPTAMPPHVPPRAGSRMRGSRDTGTVTRVP